MPYFKDIYKDLSARSDKPTKGINRLVFIEVSSLYYKKKINRILCKILRNCHFSLTIILITLII